LGNYFFSLEASVPTSSSHFRAFSQPKVRVSKTCYTEGSSGSIFKSASQRFLTFQPSSGDFHNGISGTETGIVG
jgi:hypothetical protein